MSVRSFDLTGGRLEIAQQMETENEAGVVVWDAAIVLAHYLHKNPYELKGKRVVELGSGTGVVGLAAALLGANVILTDLPRMMDLLQRNIEGNSQESQVRALPLTWGQDLSGLEAPFDFVLASDVVYNRHDFHKLASTLESLSGPNTKIVMSHEHREGMHEFFEILRQQGSVREVPLEELDQDWACEDISVVEVAFSIS
ncbi:hypothetical protein BSKO_08462 [Bryopsis sp. KO-2023]|nr:hypothetical protein BSKO_08462 [Bryopsis sp. KO-2023]